MRSNGLKIRWEQSREGSSPSLGTNHSNNLQPPEFDLEHLNGVQSVAQRVSAQIAEENVVSA